MFVAEIKKPSPSPEPERKFKKPSEMKKGEGSPFGSPRPSHVSNGPTSRPAKPPPSESKPPVIESKKPAKPPTAPKNARISDLMKRFEKSPDPEQGTPSQSPSPKHDITSPAHRSDALAPPKRIDPDVSPVSGRKFNKRDSYSDLKKKFEDGTGHSDRSASPSSRESSRTTSPDKPSGGPSGTSPAPPWMKNRVNEERPGPKPFVKSPSPHELPPRGDRPVPPRAKEPPRPPPVEQPPPMARKSPQPGRRFPPPPGPAPPEPEDEMIEEEEESDPKQAFVYK